MKRLTISAFIAIIVAGCSTVPVEVPIVKGPSITIARDTGFTGSGCTYEVMIDQNPVGKLEAGNILTISVIPGEHKVTLKTGSLLCGNMIMSRTVLVRNENVRYRVGTGSNFQWFFEETEN